MASSKIALFLVRNNRINVSRRILNSKTMSSGGILEYQSPNHITSFLNQTQDDNIPTEKQLTFAQHLAAQRGMADIPQEAKLTSLGVSLFIEESLGIVQTSENPTEKQQAFVKKLCIERGIELESVSHRMNSKKECSELIDELLSSPPTVNNNSSDLPTVNQLSFIQVLCSQGNIPFDTNSEHFATKKSCGKYIHSLLSSSSSSPTTDYSSSELNNDSKPTNKQVHLMVSLARKSKLGIPFDAIDTKQGAHDFITSLLAPQPTMTTDHNTTTTTTQPPINTSSPFVQTPSSNSRGIKIDADEPSLLMSDCSGGEGQPMGEDDAKLLF